MNYIPEFLPTNSTSFLSNSSSQNIVKSFLRTMSWSFKAESLLFNSFHELESRVLDTLKTKLSIPIYPVGPLIPHILLEKAPKDPYYLKWLDAQPRCSVLYVSLGSFLPLSGTQVDEIALGLGASGHHFLWVTRAETEHAQSVHGDTGLVVPWCDQLKVLSHPSVGGFLTHCGWSSVLEGLYAGVPMLTFPLMWDQYPNSKLIVEEWKVGLRLTNEKKGVVGREEIAHLVRKLMHLDEDENKELQRRLGDLNEKTRAALMGKGSSATNLDAFVQCITHRGRRGSQDS
ncbi:putative UDP-glycosyltransferase 87A2 [Cocos nucifera]|nr:putative UDP-glycosyltransferase 87A2 [Cocos nucifera]